MMEGLITDSIDPYLKGYSAFNQDVSIFDFANVIVSKNYKENDRVRLVSGGNISQIQYVGQGMLTASVQGSATLSPTPNAVLRTLRELSINHVKGILVIVQASSTNILNFGLAVQRADNDDLKVMFLGVSDDCKNTKVTKADKRGLSGVVLVNKIAGALADSNKSLPVIYEYCKKVIDNIISCSTNVRKNLVYRECLYCKRCAEKMDGVKGKKKYSTKKVSFSNILQEVVSELFMNITANDTLALTPEVPVVLLVNNMGALSEREEYLFLKECLEFLNLKEVKVARCFIGTFLNLGSNVDLSLTLLKVFEKEQLLHLLDYPCSAPGWKPVVQRAPFLSLDNVISGGLKRKCRLSPPIKGPKLGDKAANVVQLCLQFACDALISCEKMLNKMDADKGDGDTGTRLKTVAEVLNRRVCSKKLDMVYPFTFFLSLSKLLENAVGSTMGCIYSIIFEAAANKFGQYKEEDEVTSGMWLEAFENACVAVKKYGNVEEGDKTMYDPLQACASTLRQNLTPPQYMEAFGMGVAKAEETAQNTKKSGHKYPDAGAHAVGIWLRAVYEGVKLRCLK